MSARAVRASTFGPVLLVVALAACTDDADTGTNNAPSTGGASSMGSGGASAAAGGSTTAGGAPASTGGGAGPGGSTAGSGGTLPADSGTPDGGPLSPGRIVMADYLGFNLPLLTLVNGVPAVDVPHYTAYVAKLKSVGLRRIRLDFHWAVLEPTQGTLSPVAMAITDDLVNRMRDDGLSVLVQFGGVPTYYAAQGCPVDQVLDRCPPNEAGTAALAARLLELAERYPSIEHWQVGNEPNLSAFALVAFDESYARMAEAVVSAFAAKGLGHKLALAGMGYYGDYTLSPAPGLQMKTGSMIMDLATLHGPLVSSLAAVAYHPYTDGPEGEPNGLNPMTTGDFVTRASALNASLRATGNVRQLWATEFGWSTYPALNGIEVQTPISEDTHARYVLRRLGLTLGLDYERAYLFDLSDMGALPVTVPYPSRSGSERDDFYGFLRNDGTEKPAFSAVACFLEVTGAELLPLPAIATTSGEPSSTYGALFQRADGKHVWMARSPQPATVSLPGVTAATAHDCVSRSVTPLSAAAGRVDVPVTQELQLVVF